MCVWKIAKYSFANIKKMTCKIPCKLLSAFNRHFRGVDVMRHGSSRDEGSKNQFSITSAVAVDEAGCCQERAEARLILGDLRFEIWDLRLRLKLKLRLRWNWNCVCGKRAGTSRDCRHQRPDTRSDWSAARRAGCSIHGSFSPLWFENQSTWKCFMKFANSRYYTWLHDIAKSSKLRIVLAGSWIPYFPRLFSV